MNMTAPSTNKPQISSEEAFAAWNAQQLAAVEQALSDWVGVRAPEQLAQAMRYAVLDGGKRLRPLLVLAANEAVGGHYPAALRAACAVELIHAYSLVHDDMPCMDNDVLRRGKPTVHVQFGEAQALLAGEVMAVAYSGFREGQHPDRGEGAANPTRGTGGRGGCSTPPATRSTTTVPARCGRVSWTATTSCSR